MESLLGQFYSRISGSQEDIASEGLVYLLNRSKRAADALAMLINVECGLTLSNLTFKTQATGDNRERPDISGFDETNTEKVIIEAKFWAGLTANQPNEYLRRLSLNGGVLVFICPSLRVGLLWNEINRLIPGGNIGHSYDGEKQVATLENGSFVIVKTWDQILNLVKTALTQESDPDTKEALNSDVNQIIGFCGRVDNESFLPINESDMSPSVGRRIYSYYSLIDKVLGRLITRQAVEIDTVGLRATPQRTGYVRYFKSGRLALFLTLNFEFWFLHAETPFWLGLNMDSSPRWVVTHELSFACKRVEPINHVPMIEISGTPYFPLYPENNEIEDVVIDALAIEVENLIQETLKHLPSVSDVPTNNL